ncbi:hypothetical protein CC86DRAFT_136873 [Ophiobolus disseminans]|uniref:Transcriptional activator of proteases prtT n=1 Tax=Ophiobolus disseminans TaxID=1469910 RepID=A0A6A7ADL5_9PLEO|nr:hypothetical protein CC86DRAFT_136873 [Ophiobolus disseminans]
MPPDRGRASQACAACRKQKTRCYETATGRACLRCERLGQHCTLADNFQPRMSTCEPTVAWPNNTVAPPGEDQSARLERLEWTINTLTQRVNVLEADRSHTDSHHEEAAAYQTPVNEDQLISHSQNQGQSTDQNSAPLFVLRDVATDPGYPENKNNELQGFERAAFNSPSQGALDDIIVKRLVSPQEAYSLLALFQAHYARWVSFDKTTPTAVLLENVRKYPLLLTACCLIAVRHSSHESALHLAPLLFKEAKSLLSIALLSTPQPIEFFQGALILSMWSTTIAKVPLSFDSWLLSGFGLQHSIATTLFNSSMINSGSGCSKPALDRLCVWNHICLVHLHYCVGTRRRAVIDRKDIDRCRLILGSENATNFETRMVAEIFLYWALYESFNSPVDLPRAQAALQAWKSEWQYVFDRPRSQFLKMGFYFAQLLTYDQSLKTRSTAARESLINEMIRLSTAIVSLAMNTTDERTRHLTDHIYHMISFAAVTLSRLLHTYEPQLAASHDIPGLEDLISSLVAWLHDIGSPSHIAHTMGNVVTAFHKKLRRGSGLSPTASFEDVDTEIHDDFAQLFPELFGARPFIVGSVSMLPDFQPLD